MKTQFYRQPSGGFRRVLRPGVGLFIGVAVVLIVLALLLLRTFAPGVLVMASRPLWNMGTSLTGAVENSTDRLGNITSVTKERDASAYDVQTLTNENAVLTARIHDLELLTGNGSTTMRGVPAGVLARPPITPYDVLIVSVPSGSSIAVGDLATAEGGIPVGVISSLSATSARVELFSASGKDTDGWIGAARTPFTLHGMGAGAFEASVPSTVTVTEGDEVFVPGPGALSLGIVQKIDRDPSSPNTVLHIRPRVNPFTITWVEILSTHT